MLTQVDVQSENPFYLKIRDARPTDSIILEKIEGLDPPDITLFMGEYASDGGSYGGRRVPPRTVAFTFSLNPNYKINETVDGLRKFLHKAFLDPFVDVDGLNFVLHDDTDPDRYFSGHTEKFITEPFSDDLSVRIEVRCPNPYILDSNITSYVASGPTFPFEYSGTAETGMVIEAEITTSTSLVTLDLNGRKMFLEYDFLDGDQLIVDTRRGSRGIQVVRAGTPTDILYSKRSDSVWLELHSPSNVLKVYGNIEASVVANLTDISFRAQHWGI